MTFDTVKLKAIMEEDAFTLTDKLQLIVGLEDLSDANVSDVEIYIKSISKIRLGRLEKYISAKIELLDAEHSYEDIVAELQNTSKDNITWMTESKMFWEDSVNYWKDAMNTITEEIKIQEEVINFLQSKDVTNLLQPTEKKEC